MNRTHLSNKLAADASVGCLQGVSTVEVERLRSVPLKLGVCEWTVVMITKEQVMPLLLEACPSFSKRWEQHLTFYENEDEQLLYIDLGELAHHLVELQKTSRVEEFRPLFEVVERLHLQGDHFVKEAATIGLLEGIQNIAANNGLEPEAFVRYLGPESRKWWRQLNEFWNGKIPYVGATIDDS